MQYTYSHLEDYIHQLLQRIDIYHPHQLNIETIAPRLGIEVHYFPHQSLYIAGKVFLDDRSTQEVHWQDFGHELCHALWHAGDQALIPVTMRELQEWKANNFAQYFCIPTGMLDRLKLPLNDRKAIWTIMQTFGVEEEFARQRLQQHQLKLYAGRY